MLILTLISVLGAAIAAGSWSHPSLVVLPGARSARSSGYFRERWDSLSYRIFVAALLASDAPTRASLGPAAALVPGLAFDFILIPFYGAVGAAIAG